jgi:FdhD protein
MNRTDSINAVLYTEEVEEDASGLIVKEFPLNIIFNNRDLVTLLCSPSNLEYLVLGFLVSEGLINSLDDIKEIIIDDETGTARVETKDNRTSCERSFKPLIASAGGKGNSSFDLSGIQSQVESSITVSDIQAFTLLNELLNCSSIYRLTHGVHSAALCSKKDILISHDDIGRHNAIDKVFGECMVKGISTEDCIMTISGRISSEVLLKVAKRRIPILISKAAPTDLGVKLANYLGISVIYIRFKDTVNGNNMKIYSHGWRVTTGT